MNCPSCGREVDTDSRFCKHCGLTFRRRPQYHWDGSRLVLAGNPHQEGNTSEGHQRLRGFFNAGSSSRERPRLGHNCTVQGTRRESLLPNCNETSRYRWSGTSFVNKLLRRRSKGLGRTENLVVG